MTDPIRASLGRALRLLPLTAALLGAFAIVLALITRRYIRKSLA